MRTEFFISLRYLATKRKEKFISLISIISILGIAIGVAALIIVISVMSGFDRDLHEKIVGNYSHLTIAGYNGLSLQEYGEIAKKLTGYPHVTGFSPYVQGQVLVKESERFFAVGIKGVEPASETKTSKLDKYIISGSLENLTPGSIILGRELEMYLGLPQGGMVKVYSPQGKEHILKVSGIFASGMYDYDMNLVFVNIKTTQEILGLGERFSAIAVKLDNPNQADKIIAPLSELVGPQYLLKSWTQANANFFAALKLEKLTMFIILTLIILVAAFNIVSTLTVMVIEKTKDIGILKAIGMTSGDIRRIFTFQGLLIGFLGTFFGVSAGLALCALLKKYQFIKLPQDIYYIDKLPVQVNWLDITWVVLAAVAITLVSTIYPANKAAKLEPVEALRYE